MRYDAVLTRGLAREIGDLWIGHRVTGLWLGPGRREAWLRFGCEPDVPTGLGFLLHPSRGFIVAASAPRHASGDTGRWLEFRRLFLAKVGSPADERLLELELAGGRRDVRPDLPPVFRLYVELHTNQWNAVLARGVDHRIEAVLWPREAGGRVLRAGRLYERPEGVRAWADTVPSEEEWAGLLEPVAPGKRRKALLASTAWTSTLNVDWILGGAGREECPSGALREAYERYLRLRAARQRGAFLWSRGGVTQPYPLALETGARRAGSLLQAMERAAADAGTRLPDEAGGLTTADADTMEILLRRRISELEKRGVALRRQLEGEPADALRDIGHLLLARQADVPTGAAIVRLDNFDGSTVEIELDPRLDAVRNAERYYRKARRRERAARSIPERLHRTERRIARFEEGLATLLSSGPSDGLWELLGGRPAEKAASRGAARQAASENLPYRRFRSSGGLEIRVGRSSRSNDDLTFRHSAPDDIWLHARQAAGAHVILRWDRRDQNPPLPDLTEAAVLAALHSEARHSGMVAVDWTRRKHVRKPRKAPAGAVIPERVSTLFVEPDRNLPERLDPDG